MFTLRITTDDDFSINYQGQCICDDFNIIIAGDPYPILQEIKDNLGGPWGSPSGGKNWDIKEWLQEIIDGKLDRFNCGGNRTIHFNPITIDRALSTSKELLTKAFEHANETGFLKLLETEVSSHAITEVCAGVTGFVLTPTEES